MLSLNMECQLVHTNKNLCNTANSASSQILDSPEGSSPLLQIFKCLRFHIDAIPLRLLATLRGIDRTNEVLRAELNAQLRDTTKITHKKRKQPTERKKL